MHKQAKTAEAAVQKATDKSVSAPKRKHVRSILTDSLRNARQCNIVFLHCDFLCCYALNKLVSKKV